MLYLADAEVRRLLTLERAVEAIDQAFRDFAGNAAAVQPRVRTAIGDTKLSTMGAVLPSQGVAGAKVYTTVGGVFSFVVLLFSTADGRPLATIEANAFTAIRTAAVSTVAARRLAATPGGTLALFGTGTQARAHAQAFAKFLGVERIKVVSRGNAQDFIAELRQSTGCEVGADTADNAVAGSNLIVTATRAKEPLFDGRNVAAGAFIAAVGSTLPNTAELDVETVRRASTIVVEWLAQAHEEAGELRQAADEGVLDWRDVKELGHIVSGQTRARNSLEDIILFESLGIGLEDVAVAAAVYRIAAQDGDRHA